MVNGRIRFAHSAIIRRCRPVAAAAAEKGTLVKGGHKRQSMHLRVGSVLYSSVDRRTIGARFDSILLALCMYRCSERQCSHTRSLRACFDDICASYPGYFARTANKSRKKGGHETDPGRLRTLRRSTQGTTSCVQQALELRPDWFALGHTLGHGTRQYVHCAHRTAQQSTRQSRIFGLKQHGCCSAPIELFIFLNTRAPDQQHKQDACSAPTHTVPHMCTGE